jgi:hypothetical protein
MAVFIAKKRSTPSEALGFLSGDARFKDSYKLKLAICKNPKTPQRIVFSHLKFLRIFDLGDLTRDQTVPITVRQKTEMMLQEKIPSMPSGVKKALSRRASSTIVIMLMERGDKEVISMCLESPILTEAHICAIINKANVKPLVIHSIAGCQKWSVLYSVRYALILNNSTPMVYVTKFIPGMRTRDLQELYLNPDLPGSARHFIFFELRERGVPVEVPPDEVFEIGDDDSANDAGSDDGEVQEH